MEQERVELMNGFRKEEDEEMDVGQDDTVSSRWSSKDFYFIFVCFYHQLPDSPHQNPSLHRMVHRC